MAIKTSTKNKMKLVIVLSSICFSFVICEHDDYLDYTADYTESFRRNDSNRYLNSLQIIRKYGYPAEAYTVQTADGYLLQMHRIPHGLDPKIRKNPPIFIQHGLLGSSSDFLLLGANESIAFILADLGYDVWLGNVRGNTYSRAHVSINPNEKRFWNYSWHDSAMYDLPAQIDFVLNVTKQEKVVYIGHSMGTTMFLAMTSILPEYNEKVELSLLMAVVGYVKNIKSPLIRLMEPVASKLKAVLDAISDGAFLPHSELLDFFTRIICDSVKLGTKLCLETLFVITGQDPSEFNQTLLDILLGHYPSGYSLKGVYHYSQLVKSGEFRQFDYGPKGNQLQYGSTAPPDYNVEKITVPMYFYQGRNDYLSTIPDVKRLSKRLRTLRDVRIIHYPKFTHLDFLISEHVTELLNNRLIEDLESFLKR